jgi:hypothetical protein
VVGDEDEEGEGKPDQNKGLSKRLNGQRAAQWMRVARFACLRCCSSVLAGTAVVQHAQSCVWH